MKMRVALSAFSLCLALPVPTGAQVSDHLECYRIKDPQAKTSYTADLGGLVAEPGCTIKVPATIACVPATKMNVTPPPPGEGGMGTPNSFFCYKVKCPRGPFPTLAGTDQFGSRTVTPKTATLLCAPLAGPPTTTTTSTTTSSTTSTTSACFTLLQQCGNGCLCLANVSRGGFFCGVAESLIGAQVTFAGCICNRGPGLCSSLGGLNFCAQVCGQ